MKKHPTIILDPNEQALDFMEAYKVVMKTPTHPAIAYPFKITKKGTSKKYVIGVEHDSSWACNCPSFIFQKKDEREGCKHIIGLKAIC